MEAAGGGGGGQPEGGTARCSKPDVATGAVDFSGGGGENATEEGGSRLPAGNSGCSVRVRPEVSLRARTALHARNIRLLFGHEPKCLWVFGSGETRNVCTERRLFPGRGIIM